MELATKNEEKFGDGVDVPAYKDENMSNESDKNHSKLYGNCQFFCLEKIGDVCEAGMEKILVIMGNHSPMPSSVSNCTKPLIDGLACAGFEIDIVTDRKAPCILKNEKIGDVNVHRIDDHRTMAIILLNELKKIHLPKGLQAVTKFFVNVLKALCYIRFYSRESRKGVFGLVRRTSDCSLYGIG